MIDPEYNISAAQDFARAFQQEKLEGLKELWLNVSKEAYDVMMNDVENAATDPRLYALPSSCGYGVVAQGKELVYDGFHSPDESNPTDFSYEGLDAYFRIRNEKSEGLSSIFVTGDPRAKWLEDYGTPVLTGARLYLETAIPKRHGQDS